MEITPEQTTLKFSKDDRVVYAHLNFDEHRVTFENNQGENEFIFDAFDPDFELWLDVIELLKEAVKEADRIMNE